MIFMIHAHLTFPPYIRYVLLPHLDFDISLYFRSSFEQDMTLPLFCLFKVHDAMAGGQVSKPIRKNTSFKITNILPSRPPSNDPEDSGEDEDEEEEDLTESVSENVDPTTAEASYAQQHQQQQQHLAAQQQAYQAQKQQQQQQNNNAARFTAAQPVVTARPPPHPNTQQSGSNPPSRNPMAPLNGPAAGMNLTRRSSTENASLNAMRRPSGNLPLTPFWANRRPTSVSATSYFLSNNRLCSASSLGWVDLTIGPRDRFKVSEH